MPAITTAQLSMLMPNCPAPDVWSDVLSTAMKKFNINTEQRMAAFLAQVAHESSQLTSFTDNPSYTAKHLMRAWPNRFPSLEKALLYERNPEKLANYLYAKRRGNGDEMSGDGWRYRGRGIIRLAGRSNYRAAGEAIGVPLEDLPELLEQPGVASLTAAWFWKCRGLNELADGRYGENQDFITIIKRIKGGIVGLKERMEYWKKARCILVE